MAQIINTDAFLNQLQAGLHAEMMAAAEPLLEKALDQMRAEMRKRLAAMLVGYLETTYSVERNHDMLYIKVALAKPSE